MLTNGKKWVLCIAIVIFALTGCGKGKASRETENDSGSLENRNADISAELVFRQRMDLQYAKEFTVDCYQDGYTLLSVTDGGRYLVVPEGKTAPEDLEEGITVLQQPLDHIYLVASAAMDMVCELGSEDAIRFSGQKADGWCIEKAEEEMQKGNILYAGKYNMPDYELIVSEGCSLAIENNMISHSPEVIEKLESFGIPVCIDRSSYEEHPLGRVEWIKFYGVLFGKEEEADRLFGEQTAILNRIAADEPSDKTVAFFYITSNGMINVRRSSDYVPKMIELAGGKYIFDDLDSEESNRSTLTMQAEQFYYGAKEADYLVYNSTVDGEIRTVDELLAKENTLKDFKAVKEGNVWCTTRDLYQQSMSLGAMMEDFHNMLLGEEKDMRFLYPLE